MGMTIAEKILARNSGQAVVHAGQYVDAKVDRIFAHEEFYRLQVAVESAGIAGGIPAAGAGAAPIWRASASTIRLNMPTRRG